MALRWRQPMACGLGLLLPLAACAAATLPAQNVVQAQVLPGPLPRLPAMPQPGTSGSDADNALQAEICLHRGQQQQVLGDYLQAEAYFDEAATRAPQLAAARLGLGQVWLMRAMASRDAALLRLARQVTQQALSLAPQDAASKRLLALIDEALQRP